MKVFSTAERRRKSATFAREVEGRRRQCRDIFERDRVSHQDNAGVPRRAPFSLLAQVPAALRDVILDFHWDIERLHALDLPACRVAVTELAWHLDLPFWSAHGVPFQVSPNEVAADPAAHQQHWQRTHAADLGYPLDAYLRPDAQIVVLDGIHRLLKASLMERIDMPVRVLASHGFDAIAVPAPPPKSLSKSGGPGVLPSSRAASAVGTHSKDVLDSGVR